MLANSFTTMIQPQNGPSQDPNQLSTTCPNAHTHRNITDSALTVISLNIEGFSANKAQLLADLSQTTHCDILCLQETHRDHDQLRPQISGLTLVAEIPHPKHGSAIFVKDNLLVVSAHTSSQDSIEILTIDTGKCTVTSVYKPPTKPFKFWKTANFDDRDLKIIVGDFNSHSITWGYRQNNSDGNVVEQWAEAENLHLIHNSKLPASFNSHRWKRGYNPDLIFVSNKLKKLCIKTVCPAIPNTQHRPIACHLRAAVSPNLVPFRRRFNFTKADWQQFSSYVGEQLSNLDPIPQNYDKFVNIVWTASRKHIPRGCRSIHIPGLKPDSAKLLTEYQTLYDSDPFAENTIEAGNELMTKLKESRKEQWINTITDIDMTRNSRKAWSTLRKLTGDPPPPSNPGKVTANQVAHQLLLNGKPTKKLPRVPKSKITPGNTTNICQPFTLTEIILSIKKLKNGKAAGVDDITVEQLKNLGPAAISWLLALFNSCLSITQIPKLWRRAKVVALLKPGKAPEDPKSYRPISLLCHTFKLFERMLLNRLTPIIEPKLIPQQAGFRPGKSCAGQILNLTEHIESGYEDKKITGVVLVDLSAAYDTVNIKRLLHKVQVLTEDCSFVQMLGQILQNRRFQVHIHTEKSRWRCQKNGLPQGSVLAPTLFNIYTNDQPSSLHTQRFVYADDLALAVQTFSFEEAEKHLTHALEDLGTYYDANALRPNPLKTKSSVFHLRNRESNRPLNLKWRDTDIEHCTHPVYLGVTLDRTLSFKSHCQKTKAKVSTRNNLLHRLTSTSWGASPSVLRTSGLSLCFSAGEYACPVWHRSSHATEVDIALNETCRIVTGCLKPTPLSKLYPLAGISPPNVRRSVACSIEKAKQENDNRHPLYHAVPSRRRLKSRKSFLNYTSASVGSASDDRLALWTAKHAPPPEYVAPAEKLPPGHELPWTVWKSLNRLRTQVGRCRSNLSKWGMIRENDTQCHCGAPVQSMPHVLACPSCPNTCTIADLMACSDNAVDVATYWSKWL